MARPDRNTGRTFLLGALHSIAGPEVDLDAHADALKATRVYRDLNLRSLIEHRDVQHESRTLRGDSENERLTVLDSSLDQAFEESGELVAPGLTFSLDLQKLLRATASGAEIAILEQLSAFNFNALIADSRYLRAHLLTGEGQWRVRGALGSGELATPALLLGGVEPPAVRPRSVCALQISQASINMISEAGRETDRFPEVAGELIAEVRELAQSCADDKDAQERAAILVEAWQGL